MATVQNVPIDRRDLVDLRSDTVTRPTPAMVEAMANAPLGDDVLGDDPTVEELEALASEMTGKAAAVYMPSGTMCNQVAIAAHTERGDAILAEEEAHILYYESGGPGVIAQVVTWTLPSKLGAMDPDDVERRIVKRSIHSPGTVLLCVENTHNRAGGTIVPLDFLQAYRAIADRHGLRMHLDGARAFNAAVALGVSIQKVAEPFDSISICLSKGLGSPVGSVLCGDAALVDKARQWRKRLGGGMRQAGVLAACGLVSLRTMVDRLADDHRRARELAAAIENVPGVCIDWERVQTNMVLVYVRGSAAEWQSALRREGVLALPPGPDRLRLVLHADIDDGMVAKAAEAFARVSREMTG